MELFFKKLLRIAIATFLALTLTFTHASYAEDSNIASNEVLLVAGGIVAVGAAIPALISLFIKHSTTPATSTTSLVSIAIKPINKTIALGYVQQFTAIGTYSDKSTQNITNNVTWSSSNGNIASIDSTKGTATANALGSTTIQATLSGITAQTNLTVTHGGPVILSTSNHNLLSYKGGTVTGTITVINNSNTTQQISLTSDISPITFTSTCNSVAAWETCTFTTSYSTPSTPPTSGINFRVVDSNNYSDAITINTVDVGDADFFDPSISGTNATGLPYAPSTFIAFSKNGYDFLYTSPNDVFKGWTKKGVFRSSDSGKTWSPVNGGGSNGLTTNTTSTTYLCLTNYILCAGTDLGVYVSADGGESWNLNFFPPGSGSKTVMSLYSSSNNKVYAGFEQSQGVYSSSDGGTTWNPVGGSDNFGIVSTIYATPDPNNPGNDTLYVYDLSDTPGVAYRGTFDGTTWTWTPLNNLSLLTPHVYSFYAMGNYLYAGTVYGIYMSNDGGITWNLVHNSHNKYAVLNFCSIGNYLYAGTEGFGEAPYTNGSGILISTDSGTTWNQYNSGLMTININAYALSAINNQIYAGTDIGIFTRNFSDISWAQTSYMLAMQTVQSLCAIGNNLYAGLSNGNGIFTSVDGGANWISTNNGLTNTNVNALYLLGSNLYAGTNGSGVFMSVNGGASWTATTGLANQNVVSFYSDNSGNLYAGTNGSGVFISKINGASWITSGLANQNVQALYSADNVVYAGTSTGDGGGGVFSSSNHGQTWQPTSTVLGQDVEALYSDATTLYAGATNDNTNGGIFYTNDLGNSWNSALSQQDIADLYYSTDGVLYAAATTLGTLPGVYYMEAGTWTQIYGSNSAYVLYSIGSSLYVGTGSGVLQNRQS